MVRNFLRLVESQVPDLAVKRAVSSEEEFRVNVNRHGEPVQLRLSPLCNVMSKSPLKSVISGSAVKETESVAVPNIYPFLSTANIEDTNIYKDEDHFGMISKIIVCRPFSSEIYS
jgi:hypothetical protein